MVSKYKIGDKGEGNYKGEDDWYPCVIQRVHPDGTYSLHYDDEEEEHYVAEHLFRLTSTTSTTTTSGLHTQSQSQNIPTSFPTTQPTVPSNTTAKFKVNDNGIGINKDHIDKLG